MVESDGYGFGAICIRTTQKAEKKSQIKHNFTHLIIGVLCQIM